KSKRAEIIHDDVIAFEKEDTDLGMSIEVAMQWTTAYSESVHTYANTINTHEGGTPEAGFRGSLTSLVNRHARATQLLRAQHDHPPRGWYPRRRLPRFTALAGQPVRPR